MSKFKCNQENHGNTRIIVEIDKSDIFLFFRFFAKPIWKLCVNKFNKIKINTYIFMIKDIQYSKKRNKQLIKVNLLHWKFLTGKFH